MTRKAYIKAREYFGLVPGDGLVLHHVDPTLRHTNRKRYDEWRPEDLIVMTTKEHSRLHNKGKKHSEETKKKISTALKDRTFSEEHRKKLSKSHKDQIPWNKGKKLSEQTRAKISESLKGQIPWNKGKKCPPLSEEHKKRIGEAHKLPVAQYTIAGELIKIWESAKAAEVEGGFDKSTIAKVCKGKRPHHKGYVWRYA